MLWTSLAWAAPGPGPTDPFALPAEVARLDNGLVVLLLEDHRTDTVALQIDYGVGSRDEAQGELGCAHLFEHLMFEGSRNVGENQFDEWLAAAGGENNASTDEDRTKYHETFPSGALDVALFLESDRLGFLDAGLTDAAVANQQDVVLQERAEGYAEPNGRDIDALSRLLYPPDHPYHHPVIGTVADIRGFQLEAVRSFWDRHYRSRNAVLVLVGNFDRAQALERVRYWFSDVPDRGDPVPRVTAPTPTARPPAHGLVEDEVEERTLYLVWPGVEPKHPDMAALDLLSTVLSNGRGTRLDDRLYYSGKASSVGTWTWNSDLAGTFGVYVASPETPLVKLERAIEKEIAKIAAEPPSVAEVDRARQTMRAGILGGLESPEGKASSINYCWSLYGTPDCWTTEWKKYEAVTPADVSRVAATWLVARAPTTLSNVPKGDAASALPGAVAVELP
ncbi:MAG: pitrilysin family protein [Myxococcota bacterium]